jgi:hypothetical protein
MFVHQTIPHFVYKSNHNYIYFCLAHIILNPDGLSVNLIWRPLTKGFYTLIINGEPVKTRTK